MFSINDYLDVVPLPVLLVAPILLAMAFFFCPSRLRLTTALIIFPPFLVIGNLPGLGAIALGAKAMGFAMILAVGVSAMLTPGEKRRLSPLCYLYLPLALVGPIFILTTDDNLIPIVNSIQWICMVFTAIMVSRTIVDAKSLILTLRSLAIGFLFVIPILFSAILTGKWSYTGHSRFEPYGASSVQTAVIFTIAGGLGFYFAFRDRLLFMRPIWIGLVGASVGMALLSGTRSVLVMLMGVCLPVGLYSMRRPVLAIPMVMIVLLGVGFVLSRVESNPFNRYSTVETARGTQALLYIRESIAERPLTGLLGTSGMNADVDESLGFHTHNAYLKVAYTGGLVLLIPYLFLAGLSFLSAWYVWKNRRLLDADPLLMSVLVMFMTMIYAHGMVNHMIYLATHTWAFLHLVLSMLFMTMAGEILRFKREHTETASMMLQMPRATA
ncbi:MAG: hypothetical protein KIT54_05125 [Phycisphaeraceae bacterium]|nr:hypothetical protein [Phycisphaeraceae bacterium]